MKITEIIKAVFYLALITLGIVIAFIVWETKSSVRYIGILWWGLIGYGSFQFSDLITRLIFSKKNPHNLDLDVEMLTIIVGKKTGLRVNFVFTLIFILIFGFSMYLTFATTGFYARNQLKKYGEKQKVVIKEIRYVGKGGTYAFFDFYINGRVHTDRLRVGDYKVGDTATIIFSTHNPDVISWADEFSSK